MPLTIVTHDGKFHADDVLACAVVKAVHEAEGAEVVVVRTRDPALTTSRSPDRIVVDVGGVHDGRLMFDHHQTGAPRRPDGTPYSAFGLVWQQYGFMFVADVVSPPDSLAPPADPSKPFAEMDESRRIAEKTTEDVDAKFVAEIDAFDNGVGKPQTGHVSNLVETLAPKGPFEDSVQASRALDAAFMEAVAIMGRFLTGYVRDLADSHRSVREFEKKASYLEDGRVAVLPEGMPWKRAVFDLGLDDLLYAIFPKEDGSTWYCAAAPDAPGSFGQRKPLPEAWAGLRDADLAAVTGVADAVFCHGARFICGARSKEGALELARMACAA